MRVSVSFAIISLLVFALPMGAQMADNELDISFGSTEFLGTVDGDATVFGLHYTRYWFANVSTKFGLTMFAGEVGEVPLSEGNVIRPGDLEIRTVSGLVQYHFVRDRILSPFLGAGIASVQFSSIGDFVADGKVAGLFSAGADLKISSAWGGTADVTYMPYQGDFKHTPFFQPEISGKVDVDPLTASAALKFRW